MPDPSTPVAATRHDVLASAAASDDKAQALHSEVLDELDQLRRTLVAVTRSEVGHGTDVVRAEVRLSRTAAARSSADALAAIDGLGRRRLRSMLLAVALAATSAAGVGVAVAVLHGWSP